MLDGEKVGLELRDKAERRRSSSEAHGRSRENLTADPRNLARYMSPPLDAIYPLEYAYYLLDDVRHKTVLDLGCGGGENTLILAYRGAKVVGLDLSPELVAIAERRVRINGQTAQLVVASAYATGLRGESIDVVFGEAILHHLDLESAASEIRRILRPGGYAVFAEPIRDSATLRFLRRLIPYQQPDVSPYEYPLTRKQLDDFTRGFQVSATRRFFLPPTRLARLIGWRSQLPPKVDRWLLDAAPWVGHFAATVVFRMGPSPCRSSAAAANSYYTAQL